MDPNNASWRQRLAALPDALRKEVLATLDVETLEAVTESWDFQARPDQIPPTDDFVVWIVLGGRGAGKTRTVGEWCHDRIDMHLAAIGDGGKIHRIGAGGRSSADVRESLVEGESGLMAVAERRGLEAKYQPSKKRISWMEGGREYARASLFTAEEPDQARGPAYHTLIADEFAAWDFSITDELGNNLWTNMMFGLRLEQERALPPQAALSTTPKRIPELREMVADALDEDNTGYVLSRASTMANEANLSPVFLQKVISQYEGTRMYQQEVMGLLLDDDEDALWLQSDITNAHRFIQHPERIPSVSKGVVGVDPPTKLNRDHCGIVAVGLLAAPLPGSNRKCVMVMDDRSTRGSPDKWGSAVVKTCREHGITDVAAESNQGGEMVRSVINNADPDGNINVHLVNATHSKKLRAEPVAQLYEQQRVIHANRFTLLEQEQVDFIPDSTDSPDRLDALVHGVTWLLPHIHTKPAMATSASGLTISRGRRRMDPRDLAMSIPRR